MTAAPGGNYWCGDPEDAWVDAQGRLHLKINQKAALNNAYASVELKTPVDGCGTYNFVVDSGPDGMPDALDKNCVLGLFSYSDDSTQSYHEVDTEVSDWGQASPTFNLLYTTFVGGMAKNDAPTDRSLQTFGTSAFAHSFVWTPSSVNFQSVNTATSATIASSTRSTPNFASCPTSPTDVGMTARINLWLYQGKQPSSPQEVIIKDFSFTPYVQLAAPANLSALGADRMATLSWSDTSMGETGFAIERKWEYENTFTPIATVGPNVRTYVDNDPGLARARTYNYRIRAISGAATGPYAGINVTTTTGIGAYFNGPGGYVWGSTTAIASPNTFHARTWVLVDGVYYHQGVDLHPTVSGSFTAQGLWGSTGQPIFITLHPAATDQYTNPNPSTGMIEPFEDVPATQWASKFPADVKRFGPYTNPAYTQMPSLLSQGQPAVASSSSPGHGPSLAVDGVLDSGWIASPAASIPNLRVDLGGVRQLTKVTIYSGPTYWSQSYEVQMSLDAATWTTIYNDSGNTDGGIDTYNIGNNSARYVRVVLRGPRTQDGAYQMNELQVFGTP